MKKSKQDRVSLVWYIWAVTEVAVEDTHRLPPTPSWTLCTISVICVPISFQQPASDTIIWQLGVWNLGLNSKALP